MSGGISALRGITAVPSCATISSVVFMRAWLCHMAVKIAGNAIFASTCMSTRFSFRSANPQAPLTICDCMWFRLTKLKIGDVTQCPRERLSTRGTCCRCVTKKNTYDWKQKAPVLSRLGLLLNLISACSFGVATLSCTRARRAFAPKSTPLQTRFRSALT